LLYKKKINPLIEIKWTEVSKSTTCNCGQSRYLFSCRPLLACSFAITTKSPLSLRGLMNSETFSYVMGSRRISLPTLVSKLIFPVSTFRPQIYLRCQGHGVQNFTLCISRWSHIHSKTMNKLIKKENIYKLLL